MSDNYQGVSESFLNEITGRIQRLKTLTKQNGVTFPVQLEQTLQTLTYKKKAAQHSLSQDPNPEQVESICDISIQSSANDLQSQVQSMKAKTNKIRDLLADKLQALKEANSATFHQKNDSYYSELSAMKRSMTALIDQTRNTKKQIEELKNYTLNMEKESEFSRTFPRGAMDDYRVSFNEAPLIEKIKLLQQDMNSVMGKVEQSIEALNEQNAENRQLKESIRELQLVLEEEDLSYNQKESACQCLLF